MLTAAVVSLVAAILSAEHLGPEALQVRLLAAATLGLPLFTAVALAGEQQSSRARRIAAPLVAALVLLAIYADWPSWTERAQLLRYAQLSIALHLMVAFLPFGRADRPVAFWQYNRALFIRIVAAAVSSATLYAGLALALVALDKLFGVFVAPQGYGRLWFVVTFVFNTWFFLGGLPEDVANLEEQNYPTGLRVFAQYTLVPLVSLYLVILTLYFAKVLITRDWPSGWIGWLVSGVSSGGILALLLVHPLAERPDQKWIATFARDFWIGLVPAIVMLWLAIYQRVHQYGITEPRYFLLVVSLWLAAIAAWYIATRSRKIRAIPISLCAVALVTFAGPWGAYATSQRSQLGRLERLLVKDGVLVGGRVQRAHGEVSPVDLKEISEIARYEVETHGGGKFAPWLGDSVARRIGIGPSGWNGGDGQARNIVDALGVRYVDRWESPARGGPRVQFTTNEAPGALALRGFDYLVPIREARGDSTAHDTSLIAVVAQDGRAIRVLHRGQVLIDVPLDSLMRRALLAAGRRRSAALPSELRTIRAENTRARVEVHLRELGVIDRAPAAPDLRSASGDVLLKLK
ncbi:MAG: DUF4153 domain-containing protein [Gemmatimonadales bacterium]